jgi:hypothetical protein
MIKRDIKIILLVCLILAAIADGAFSKNNNELRHKVNKPANADNNSNSLIMGQMPQAVILGRPTDHSITVNVYAQQDMEFFIEYGDNKSQYNSKTGIKKLSANNTQNVVIDGLKPNTEYYYRILSKKSEQSDFATAEQYPFHTQRLAGNSFCFVVQADSHLDEQSNLEIYKQTLFNELADKPDFMIDLGDTFMSDKLNEPSQANIISRHLLQRGYFSLICHSVPLYLALGNHEGEQGWRLNGTKDNLAVWATQTRKTYFPNPVPDGFYTSNTKAENFVGLRENYYAWTWGDGLFVVLDPYWYTVNKPGRNSDNWGRTLGQVQYNWLKDVLEKSNAKFKFVFCHQLIGGKDSDGRGGAEFAKYYEMGGLNEDGSRGFDKKRPGWAKPIHKLMADNNVTVFFHGHDHFFAKQELDGVIYQLVPQPSHPNFKKAGQASDYGYTTGNILPNSGHLRITVSPQQVKVDYIRAYLIADETGERKNGEAAYSYTITR